MKLSETVGIQIRVLMGLWQFLGATIVVRLQATAGEITP